MPSGDAMITGEDRDQWRIDNRGNPAGPGGQPFGYVLQPPERPLGLAGACVERADTCGGAFIRAIEGTQKIAKIIEWKSICHVVRACLFLRAPYAWPCPSLNTICAF